MAMEDITPGVVQSVFPYQRNVAYSDIAKTTQIAKIRGYTFKQIYGMIRTALVSAGVSPDSISWEFVLFFMREILNDYSGKVGEFLRGLEFEGGGAVFRIPALRKIYYVAVNGYAAAPVAESVMTDFRATGSSLSDTETTYLYSYVGTILNVYPAIGDGDTIVILASLYAEDINDDAADTIVPQIDVEALYHGTLWKCLENQQKPFAQEQMEYIRLRDERASEVAGQVTPSVVQPFQGL